MAGLLVYCVGVLAPKGDISQTTNDSFVSFASGWGL
jgi:hypothetical protein